MTDLDSYIAKTSTLNEVIKVLSVESEQLLRGIHTCPVWRPFKFNALCKKHEAVIAVWDQVNSLYGDVNRRGITR